MLWIGCHVTWWPRGQVLFIALQTVWGRCFALVLWYCILFIAGCLPASQQSCFLHLIYLQLNFRHGYECDYRTVPYTNTGLCGCAVVWCLVTQQIVTNILKYLWSLIVRDTHCKMSHVGQIVCVCVRERERERKNSWPQRVMSRGGNALVKTEWVKIRN